MKGAELLKAATGKPRNLNRSGGEAARSAARHVLVQDIEELEQRAHCLGMLIAAGALNNAKNAAGWEMAGDIEAAEMASRGQRRKRR